MNNKNKREVALVLSGGGARGFGHIGVLEVLEEKGFKVNRIVGTSMGSLVGGLYAMGELQNFKNWVTSIKKYQALELIDISLKRRGLLKGNRVFAKMKKLFPTQNIEDLPIAFTSISTQLYAKKVVAITEGDIYEAIRSSVAIPTLFSPVEMDNDVLVDGGILNNLPIEHANKAKNELLIVVDVNAFTPLNEENKVRSRVNYSSVLTQTIGVLLETNSKDSLQKYPPDLLIQLSRDSCEIFDFFKAKKQIEYGRACAEQAIEQFLQK